MQIKMNKQIYIQPNQTIWDIALQEYGSVDFVYSILKANPTLTIDSEITPGELLIIPAVLGVKQKIVNYYKSIGHSPASGSLNAQVPVVPVLDPWVTNGLIQHLIGGVGVIGNVWTDQSGYGANAELKNNPTINVDNIELDGISQYIDLLLGTNSSAFTHSIDVDFLTLTNYDRLLNQITNVSGTWSNRLIDNGVMTLYLGGSGWNTTTFTPLVNTKYNIVFTADNSINEVKQDWKGYKYSLSRYL